MIKKAIHYKLLEELKGRVPDQDWTDLSAEEFIEKNEEIILALVGRREVKKTLDVVKQKAPLEGGHLFDPESNIGHTGAN